MKTGLIVIGGLFLAMLFLGDGKAKQEKPDRPENDKGFIPPDEDIKTFSTVQKAKDHIEMNEYAKVDGIIYQKTPSGMVQVGGVV